MNHQTTLVAGKGNNVPPTEQTGKKAHQTAKINAFLADLSPEYQIALGGLLQPLTPLGQSAQEVDGAFSCVNPSANLEQAQADLLALLDEFTQGTSPVPFLLELVQVWSLSESCDMSQRANQRNLRLVLNLVSYLTEIQEAYNNYAFFSELAGGAEQL